MECLRSKALGGCDGEGIFLVLSRGRAGAVVMEITKTESLVYCAWCQPWTIYYQVGVTITVFQ